MDVWSVVCAACAASPWLHTMRHPHQCISLSHDMACDIQDAKVKGEHACESTHPCHAPCTCPQLGLHVSTFIDILCPSGGAAATALPQRPVGTPPASRGRAGGRALEGGDLPHPQARHMHAGNACWYTIFYSMTRDWGAMDGASSIPDPNTCKHILPVSIRGLVTCHAM